MMIQAPNKLPPTTPNITGNTDVLLLLGGLVSTIVITLDAIVFVFTTTLLSVRMFVALEVMVAMLVAVS